MPLRGIGLPELLIVLTIVLLVFGAGRVGKVGKELGTAISEFRRGLKGDENQDETTPDGN
jgi:sec-independent protein translocase protein TatA